MRKTQSIIWKLLFVALLAAVTLTCEEGCIRCGLQPDNTQACEICDLYSSFYLNGENKCVQRKIENCLIPSADQNDYLCAQCKQGMMLDPTAFKCVEVPEKSQVANCRQYSLNGNCIQCYRNYYLKEGSCIAAKVLIDHCRVYFNDDLCRQCENDYYFDVEKNACVKFETIENCGKHTFGECLQCTNGFYLNSNAALQNKIDVDLGQSIAQDLWQGTNFTKYPISPCLENTQANCAAKGTVMPSGSTVPLCGSCEDGYYMDSSNSCQDNPHWRIENCIDYMNINTCSKCSDGYYVDRNQCKTRTELEGCEIYEDRKNQCHKCVEGFYNKNNDGKCFEREYKSIENCKTLSMFADDCEVCIDGFKLTDDWQKCLPVIKNCETYDLDFLKDATFFTCNKCEDKFYLSFDFKTCIPQNISHCTDYLTGTGQCEKCESPYYIDKGTNKCLRINQTGCSSPALNENKCLECQNLFKLNNDGLCIPIDNTECLMNEKNKENCLRCKPNYYMTDDDSGSFKICKVSETSKNVEYCEYSNSIANSPDKICSNCKNNLSPHEVKTFYLPYPQNCEDVEDLTGRCKKCSIDSDIIYDEATQSHTCSPASNSSSKCISQKQYRTSVLGDNDRFCEKCRNTDSYFQRYFICYERSGVISAQCSEMSEYLDRCLICQEGFTAKKVVENTDLQCSDTPSGFTPIPNCLVYNSVDPSKCVYCDWFFWLNPQFKCVKAVMQNFYPFNNFGQNSIEPQTLVENDYKEDCQYLSDNQNCLKCLPGKFVLPSLRHSYTDGENFGMSLEYTEGTCEDISELVKKKVDNDFVSYVTLEECGEFSSRNRHASCRSCANGVNANIVAAEFDKDASQDISALKIYTVESCKISPGQLILSKKYSGAWYRTLLSNSYLGDIREEIEFDSCPNPSDSLIAVINTDIINKKYVMHIIPGDGVTPEPKYHCHNFNSGGVPNCQIYAAQPQSTAGFDYSTTAQCISCKPGFKATIKPNTGDFIISECTAIPDCDTSDSSKNTWMNACETCSGDKNYPWVQNHPSGFPMIDISSCVDNTIANCIHQENAKCYLCDTGFELNANQTTCDEITPAINGCEKAGFDSKNLKNNVFTNKFNIFQIFLKNMIRMRYQNRTITGKCQKCEPGKAHFKIGNHTSNFACTATASLPAEDLIANCKIYKGDVEKKCNQCDNGYILNNSSDSCIDNREQQYPNCIQVDSSNPSPKCTKCAEEHILNSETNLCLNIPNCTQFQTKAGPIYECLQCKDYFMVNERTRTECVPLGIPNCLQVDSDYKCTKCEPGYVFFERIHHMDYKICVKNPYSSDQLKDFSMKYTIPVSLGAKNFELLKPEKTYKIEKPNVYQVQQVCPRFLMPHCKTPNYDTFECNECDEGYHHNTSTKTCAKNFIKNCMKQKTQVECEQCEDNFFVNDLLQCSPHQVRFCKIKNKKKDQCDECEDEYWLDNDDMTCTLRIVTNCKKFLKNEDNCEECHPDYYMLNKKCLAYTVSGCLTFKDDKDECATCRKKYYLNGADDNRCHLNTAKHCKTYEDDKNECDECMISKDDTTHKNNYLKQGNMCVEFEEVSGCGKYSIDPNSNPGKCLECKDTHLMIDDQCILKPNGLRNCLVYVSPDQCERCICNYYLNSDTDRCEKVDHPITNCEYHETKDTCKECKENHLLSEDKKTCTLVSNNSCLTWKTVDSCASCVGTLVLVPTGKLDIKNEFITEECKPGISKCLKHYPSVTDDTTGNLIHTCEICNEGYFPAEDQKSCEPSKFIKYCRKMADYETCAECDDNHVLSLDKKSCSTEGELVGRNCAHGVITDKIKCGMCANGYYMNSESACVKCGGEGCAVCSSSNVSKCEICAGGFYMMEDKTCKSNPNNPFNLEKESVDGGDPIPVVNQG